MAADKLVVVNPLVPRGVFLTKGIGVHSERPTPSRKPCGRPRYRR